MTDLSVIVHKLRLADCADWRAKVQANSRCVCFAVNQVSIQLTSNDAVPLPTTIAIVTCQSPVMEIFGHSHIRCIATRDATNCK